MKQFVTPDVGVTFIPGVNLLVASSGGVTGGGATGEVGGGGQED